MIKIILYDSLNSYVPKITRLIIELAQDESSYMTSHHTI